MLIFRRIGIQRTKLEADLTSSAGDLTTRAEAITNTLQLLAHPDDLYLSMGSEGRRLLNQAVFSRLYVYRDEIVDDELRTPFADLAEVHRAGTVVETAPPSGAKHSARAKWAYTCERAVDGAGPRLLALSMGGNSSSKHDLVETIGIEPTTSALQRRRSAN